MLERPAASEMPLSRFKPASQLPLADKRSTNVMNCGGTVRWAMHSGRSRQECLAVGPQSAGSQVDPLPKVEFLQTHYLRGEANLKLQREETIAVDVVGRRHE